jgi:hypothetical protein
MIFPIVVCTLNLVASNFSIFIDWVMILPKALEAEFWQEFKEFEQERTMS